MLIPPPVQTTYQQYMAFGQVGMSGSMVPWSIDTRLLEDPTGNGVGFGLAVCQGYKSDKGATLGQLSGGAFVGITHNDITLALAFTPLANGKLRARDTYYDTDNMGVQTLGDIIVAPVGVVASGSPVYFNTVTGQLGPSTIANGLVIANATWITSLPNGSQPLVPFAGLAMVRLGAMAG
jgi:hypothetical protein